MVQGLQRRPSQRASRLTIYQHWRRVGVKSVMDRTGDFAASDAAMKTDDMAKVEGGVQLLPMTAGAIVLAYNLPEVPSLRLSREAYTGIFDGKVKKWNDPMIVQESTGAQFPD